MCSYLIPTSNLRQIIPETIFLDPEHYQRAHLVSTRLANEMLQWQSYLDVLAVIGLAEWLRKRIPGKSIDIEQYLSMTHHNGNNYPLWVGNFQLYSLAVEHVLSESIEIPADLITNPNRAAHFYVVSEVDEEQGQLIIRGCIRYDRLTNYLEQKKLQPSSHGGYVVPLAIFESEPNHLQYYLNHLQPAEIALPVSISAIKPVSCFLPSRIQLNQWLEGLFQDTWTALDRSIDLASTLEFSTRSIELETCRGKLIDLGMLLGHNPVVLIVGVSREQEREKKLTISARLYPKDRQHCLQQNVQISLLSKAGEELQVVKSRDIDNYIQLKPFKCSQGQGFSIEIRLADISIKEDFEC